MPRIKRKHTKFEGEKKGSKTTGRRLKKIRVVDEIINTNIIEEEPIPEPIPEQAPSNMNIEQDFSEASDDDYMENLRRKIAENKKAEKLKKEKKEVKQEKQEKQKQMVIEEISTLFGKDNMFPLKNRTIVISGVFSFTKDKKHVENVLKSLGGRVTNAISNKTDILIYGGKLEDGRPPQEGNKYKKAKQKGKMLIGEEDFNKQLMEVKEMTMRDISKQLRGHLNGVTKENKAASSNQSQVQSQKLKMEVDNETNTPIRQKRLKTSNLWIEKYAPESSDDIFGNTSEIRKVKKWLEDWQKADSDTIRNDPQIIKACLFSGPPGIGKTTTAKILAKECGFNFVVKNASDIRNKNSINSLLSVLGNNTVLDGSSLKKCVIIMDEVDGMSSDRGGVRELITQIKNASQPIICICNDRQSQKIRSLAQKCMDIRFKPPSEQDILMLLEGIITEEFGLDQWRSFDKDVLKNLILSAQFDIRQIVNHLQMWIKELRSSTLKQVKSDDNTSKDSMTFNNPFEAAKLLLNTNMKAKKSISELKSLFFVDYGLVHHFVFESYLTNTSRYTTTLESVDEALESFIEGDYTESLINKDRNYQLLSPMSYFSAIRPSIKIQRRLDFVHFPQSLSKISMIKKKQRLIKELRDSFCKHSHFLNDQGVVDYCQLLYIVIGKLMEEERHEELYSLYQYYDLSVPLVNENLCDLVLNSKGRGIDSVSSKSKGGFTRFFNSKQGKTTKSKAAKSNKKNNKARPVRIEEEEAESSEEEEDHLNNVFNL